MTQRVEHSWNEWDYENRRTPVWVMMLTSASCCRHVHQDSACSFSVRQDSDISSQGTASVYVIDMREEQITREDVIRRRHVLLRCADSSLNHKWSKTASFVSCFDACLDAVGVRPALERAASVNRIGTVLLSIDWNSVHFSFMWCSFAWPLLTASCFTVSQDTLILLYAPSSISSASRPFDASVSYHNSDR
jgi:hypothetical protein